MTTEDVVAPTGTEWWSPVFFCVNPGCGIPLFLLDFGLNGFFLLLALPTSVEIRTGLWSLGGRYGELDGGEFWAFSLFPRRRFTFPIASTGPNTNGGWPPRIRAATAARDPGDGRLLLLFVAGDVSFNGGW